MAGESTQNISSLRLMILAPSTTSSEQSTKKDLSQPLSSISPFPDFLKALSGTSVSSEVESFSGYTSHTPLSLKTKYYASSIGIWCDELPSTDQPEGKSENSASLTQWQTQMLSDEAEEVRAVIGGIILLLPIQTSDMLSETSRKVYVKSCLTFVQTVNALRERIEDETGRDIAAIAVSQWTTVATVASHTSAAEDAVRTMEDNALSDHGIMGWDFILLEIDNANVVAGEQSTKDFNEVQHDKFGEKQGMSRLIEVLEAVDWSQTLDHGHDEHDLGLLASEEDFFDESMFEREIFKSEKPGLKPNIKIGGSQSQSDPDPVIQQSHEFQREMMGLRFALGKQDRGEEEAEDSTDDEIDASISHDGHMADDIQVEQLADLMGRVVAIKEAAAEMSVTERQKFAKREIAKIMKEMG